MVESELVDGKKALAEHNGQSLKGRDARSKKEMVKEGSGTISRRMRTGVPGA